MDTVTFFVALVWFIIVFGLGFLCGRLSKDDKLPPTGKVNVQYKEPPALWLKKFGHRFVRVTMKSGAVIRTKARNVNWPEVKEWYLDGARA